MRQRVGNNNIYISPIFQFFFQFEERMIFPIFQI